MITIEDKDTEIIEEKDNEAEAKNTQKRSYLMIIFWINTTIGCLSQGENRYKLCMATHPNKLDEFSR